MGEAGPIYVNFLSCQSITVGQGTWVSFVSSNYLYEGAFYNSSVANGDNFSIKVRIPVTGTWTIRFNALKYNNQGIVGVYIDGSQIGSNVDLYAAATDYLNVGSVSGSITQGERALKFQINGKNASAVSPYYYVNLSGVALIR